MIKQRFIYFFPALGDESNVIGGKEFGTIRVIQEFIFKTAKPAMQFYLLPHKIIG